MSIETSDVPCIVLLGQSKLFLAFSQQISLVLGKCDENKGFSLQDNAHFA